MQLDLVLLLQLLDDSDLQIIHHSEWQNLDLPVLVTAIPHVKSKYLFPLESVTKHPLPETKMNYVT
jgi:hypothetical protein